MNGELYFTFQSKASLVFKIEVHHEPNDPKPAQSGHDGYCKKCFRQLFPERFREKQNKQKQECEMCHEVNFLVKGLCHACTGERAKTR